MTIATDNMTIFSNKDNTQVIYISQDSLNMYPESLLALTWNWHLRSHDDHTPCILENLSEENIQEIDKFYNYGVWSNPWDRETADKTKVMVEDFVVDIWDYFMLPFDIYEDRSSSVEGDSNMYDTEDEYDDDFYIEQMEKMEILDDDYESEWLY
jgi:hypothetical protein